MDQRCGFAAAVERCLRILQELFPDEVEIPDPA